MDIVITFTDQTMGGEGISSRFAGYAERRLQEVYPSANIVVSVDDSLSLTKLNVEGGDVDEVNDFLQSLWDRELDKALQE